MAIESALSAYSREFQFRPGCTHKHEEPLLKYHQDCWKSSKYAYENNKVMIWAMQGISVPCNVYRVGKSWLDGYTYNIYTIEHPSLSENLKKSDDEH